MVLFTKTDQELDTYDELLFDIKNENESFAYKHIQLLLQLFY